MIRICTLNPKTTDPPFPSTEWDDEAEKKWMIFQGRISIGDPYKRRENADGTITFMQEQAPTAIRIFAGLSSIQ